MKHLVSKILIVCLVIWPLSTVAQNISVSSFKLLDSDLTANTTGTMERDQNGEVAALIKVVTSEQGFVFDGGMVGVTKTKQMTGEIWVYVPHGIKKISIMHDKLGVLRDYYFPIAIEKARTYELVLTTGKVETIVNRTASKQYVTFTVNPSNAMVELDGMPLDVSSDGYAEKTMPYGTYSYRVSCANYHTEAGQVTVTAQGKAEVKVTLRPNFGWIQFSGAEELHGAHIYVDNERIGQLPMKSEEMVIGAHRIKVLKSLYKPYEQEVEVTEGNTTQVEVKMVANFASVTFATDADNEIWIDNKLCGKGKSTVSLEKGEYTVEVRREGHRTVSEVINVVGLDAQSFQLPSPVPMYGILDVSSAPSRATVYIDGVEVGQTPLMKSDVLVGSRKITFKKEGYETLEQIVNISENADNKLAVTLKEPTVNSVQNNVEEKLQQTDSSYEAVDLGLSVKWASCNVGAKSPEDYGDYFAWGETKTKSSYTQSNNVTYGLSERRLQSQGIIFDINLTAAYDVATVNWGSPWRMPTLDEIKELKKNCSCSWTSVNGVNGYKVTGPNGNFIFFPAAGYRYGTEVYSRGLDGFYWSATLDSNIGDYAYYLNFCGGGWDWINYYRYSGYPVRPVTDK